MGNCCLPFRIRRTSSAVNPKKVTLLLLGLDNSGKTTIAKRLAEEPIDSVVPTVGFSVVMLRQKGCHVSLYDLGGGPQIRDIWPRYYADAHGVIFVTDAHDTLKLDECRKVLQSVLQNDQMSGKPVLVLANKQDLDGALDEIDVVDRLDLERLVNEQKCPTLVELCSALDFSKKMDPGIENGYRWLIRSIIRDYPSLNNRVLKDLAQQEEENRVQLIKRGGWKMDDRENGKADGFVVGDPFKPIQTLVVEKGHLNGVTKSVKKPVAKIPGLIDDAPEKSKEKKIQIHRFLGEEIVSVAESPANSYSSEFFILERFQSDVELLNDVPNQTLKNFLVRPKSSGARLYGVRSEKKKTHRRKPLRKTNKTGPSPLADVSNDQKAEIPQGLHSAISSQEGENDTDDQNLSVDKVNPFVVTEQAKVLPSRSMPNSRRNSVRFTKKRRHSMVNGKLPEGIELSSLGSSPGLASTKEVILDVTKLVN